MYIEREMCIYSYVSLYMYRERDVYIYIHNWRERGLRAAGAARERARSLKTSSTRAISRDAI